MMTKVEHFGLHTTAWALVLSAVVFWLWFGIGSAYVERLGPMNWIMHILVPGGIFLLTGLIAWRWEQIGGALFVLEGIIAMGLVLYAFLWQEAPAVTSLLLGLTLAVVPLAAGILFLMCWWKSGASHL